MGIRMGVGSNIKSPPLKFGKNDTTWLSTIGAGSVGTDSCEFHYFSKRFRLIELTLYYRNGEGIKAILFK
ncbi:MAG: hypothetical protein ACKO96_29325 [Flammeovirgaceae bacterium]